MILQVTRSDFDFGLFYCSWCRFERVLILIPFDRIISHRHSPIHPSPLRRSFFSPTLSLLLLCWLGKKKKKIMWGARVKVAIGRAEKEGI